MYCLKDKSYKAFSPIIKANISTAAGKINSSPIVCGFFILGIQNAVANDARNKNLVHFP